MSLDILFPNPSIISLMAKLIRWANIRYITKVEGINFIMVKYMNYLKISSIAWVALLAMIRFTFESAVLTMEIDPLLVIFLEGHVDKSPPCIG